MMHGDFKAVKRTEKDFAFSEGKSSPAQAALDTVLTLWPNREYAGTNQHTGGHHARLRADALSLVLLLTPAFSLAQLIVDPARQPRREHSILLRFLLCWQL